MKISLAGMFKAIGGVVTSAPHGAAKPSRGIRRNVAMRPRVLNAGARVPYTGEQLREIRKRNGVGRQLSRLGLVQAFNRWNAKVYPGLLASHWGRPSPNLAEWQRKQRRGETAEAYRARRAEVAS